MRVGVVGMGSIGQRHVRALAALGVSDVLALRTGRGVHGRLPGDLGHVAEVWDEEDFWEAGLDGVVIANPTSLHAPTLVRAAERGVAIFVEKPLVASLEQLPTLSEPITRRVVVGYCLRFHPLVRAIRRILTAGATSPGQLGRVLKARLYFGSYLPRWQPNVDYRKQYMARRVLGGGALRTLSHELDLVQHLLGPIASVSGDVSQISDLEIDVDDSVMLVCRIEKGAVALVELDFLNPEPTRIGSFMGTSGRLDYTFSDGSARIVGYDGAVTEIRDGAADAIDGMYYAQMADFLRFADGGTSEACSFEEAAAIVRVIAAAERLKLVPVGV